MCKNCIANVILGGKKLLAFLLRLGTKEGCPLSQDLFNKILANLARAIRQEKQKYLNKKERERKRENYLFVDDVILHIENS